MSGGSYGHLCHKTGGDLVEARSHLESMQVRLAQLGYADDAAQATQRVIDLVKQIDEVPSPALAALWMAIEWWDSNDSDEDNFKETLLQYRDSVGHSLSTISGEIAEVGSAVIGGESVFFVTLKELYILPDGTPSMRACFDLFRINVRLTPLVTLARPGMGVMLIADEPDEQGVRRVYSYRRLLSL